jgi:hypothetical protein
MIIRLYAKRIKGTVDREAANAAAAKVGLIEVTDLTRKITNQATIDAPVNTGFLRGQHTMTVKVLKTRVKGTVVNRAKYASAVHDGSGPHIIRARKKKVLRFEVAGKVVFARSVRHPGTSANPWLLNAAERTAVNAGFRFTRTVVSG